MKKLTYNLDSNAIQSVEGTSNYVDVRALAANVAKSFTKPVALSKILFSANLAVGDSVTFGNLQLTAVAANPTALQFVPLSTLALTLAALIIQLQTFAGVNAVISNQAGTLTTAGTFSVTDTNTSITFTNTVSPATVVASAVTSGGANTVTQLTGARFCRLSAGALFYYSAAITATIAAVDVSNGQGSISVPATVQPMFCVDDVTSISVIAPAAIDVSAEWWA